MMSFDAWEELGLAGDTASLAEGGSLPHVDAGLHDALEALLDGVTDAESALRASSRLAWGVLRGVFGGGRCRLVRREARHGDIITVDRHFYTHLGIHATDGATPSVIHYTGAQSDTAGDARIRETSVPHFLREADAYLVLEVCPSPGRDAGLGGPWQGDGGDEGQAARLFTPQETVARARSRLGEQGYDLVANNCEHFAWWCKTGEARSEQVETVLRAVASVLARA
jgi:hypothetical protein